MYKEILHWTKLNRGKVMISFLSVFVALFFIPSISSISAQQNLNVANYLKVEDNNIKAGHIIITSEKGFIKSRSPYSKAMVGVVASKAAISFEPEKKDPENSYYPVVFSGTTFVLTTAKNGIIKKGDFLTSSDIPGVAMKATRSGPMLGIALSDYKPSNPEAISLVPISLNIKYVSLGKTLASQFESIFDLTKLTVEEEPSVFFRYLVAIISVVFSFLFAFLHFGRLSVKGIEALGRNPLASKTIQLGILLNILISITIIVAGVGLGIFVLKF